MTSTEEAARRAATKASLYGLVAANAPVAIVMRRGPKHHTQLLRWDLRADVVEPGQWIVAQMERGACGVSPNGELWVYSARKRGRRFTAVARPPYFSALAFWEEGPWTGGGFFVRDDHLVVGVTQSPEDGSLPRGLTVTDVWSYFPWSGNRRSSDTFGDAVLACPEAHQGWRRPSGRFEKPNPRRPSASLVREGPLGRAAPFRLIQAADNETIDLGVLDWADWDHEGSLVFGRDGCLHRQRVPETLGGALPSPVLIADLNQHTFVHVVAPEEARRWPRRLG